MNIGYKGVNKNFKCRDFQFEVGKTYTIEGEIKLCKNGFHFCKNPFDVWGYYDPTNRFVQISFENSIDDNDGKSVCGKIVIEKELNLIDFVNEGVKFTLNQVKDEKTQNEEKSAATNTGNSSAATNTGNYSAATNTGNYSAATNTGDSSAATNTGNYSAATNTGNYSAATVEGENSIAIVTGYKSKAKGKLGCWLVLTERNDNYDILNVKAFKIDGQIIKENVFYSLVGEEAVEIKD